MKTYPNLKAIVAPTSVGIVAAAQAVKDEGKIGQVYVTGLGLPSELAGHVDSGAVKSFAIWNPIDLGYAATMISHNLVHDNASTKQVGMGRMGVATLDENGNAAMAEPFIYDASNVHDFADVF
ncbi:substrate-binding domain-containing protein [Enterovibrio nigricans]|uniref:Autoinducer 2-binding periplasmic protein LuxP n=1 Tax=Enterovibrio nigricans DSM 22720 TaxID=1121868 RepID=A0A1T4VN81_9GAMM|nr:substrate-binding domain-containing protein [Enterovibrio nigricans]SKA66318.1 substrate-binding protein domain-containing protein [Enterovibrio nigricans DSM 22720]